MMNKKMLRSFMALNDDTYQTLSEAMNMNKATFSNKINSLATFTKSEMLFIKQKYNMTDKQFMETFFKDNEKG